MSAQSQALNGPRPPQVTAAANRFAALSPAVRHAWLAAHLPALRAGHITRPGSRDHRRVKPAPAPVVQSRRLSSGARLAWLYARSRRVPAAVVALAVCGGVLRAALNWHWAIGGGLEAQQIPLIIETGAAAAIAVTSHGPFGEPERATGRWLPCLRLFTAIGLTGWRS